MALALNNLKIVDMPLNKGTKPNHICFSLVHFLSVSKAYCVS